MRLLPLLLAMSAILTLLTQAVARADEIALSFDLPQSPAVATQVELLAPAGQTAEQTSSANAGVERLPIPEAAANPPSQVASATLPQGIYGGEDAIAMANSTQPAAGSLPPPPPLPEGQAVVLAQTAPLDLAPVPEANPAAEPALVASQPPPEPSPSETIALNFGMGPSPAELAIALAKKAPQEAAPDSKVQPLLSIFHGGSDSLVARAVGSAEGTRTAEGTPTLAYYGHTDPGNGVWNLGTFSYQHGADTPEEADLRQLQRLQAQAAVIQQKALDHGLELSLEETLNGIDLANQAPMAALGKGGYVDWLAQARTMGMAGQEAIAYSRTRSFLDPDTQRWNAPGLGNNVYSISHDQERRMLAIARTLAVYQVESPNPQKAITAAVTAVNLAPDLPKTAEPVASTLKEAVDPIFDLSLPPVSQPAVPAAPGADPPAGLNLAPGLEPAVAPTASPPLAANPTAEIAETAGVADAAAVSTPAEAVREGVQTMTEAAAGDAIDPAPAVPRVPSQPSGPEEVPGSAPTPLVILPSPRSGAEAEAEAAPPQPQPLPNQPQGHQAQADPPTEAALQGLLPSSKVDRVLFQIDT